MARTKATKTHSGWMRTSDGKMVVVDTFSAAGVISELSRLGRHAVSGGLTPVAGEVNLPNGNNVRLRWSAGFGHFNRA